MKPFLTILILFLCTSSFAQKAYELEYYKVKTKDFNIKFALGNGYIGASEVQIKDNKTKQTTKYIAEDGSENSNYKMKFIPSSTKNKSGVNYFIIDGIKDSYEILPKKFRGQLYLGIKNYKFLLNKSE